MGSVHDTTNTTDRNRTSSSQRPQPQQEQEHQPQYDSTIDDAMREQRRKEREAAAKARMDKVSSTSGTKKKKPSVASPLRGPNTKNTMTWTVS